LVFSASVIQSCSADIANVNRKPEQFSFAGLHQGQYIEWDESITSQNKIPAFFQDSISATKNKFKNLQTSNYHTKVSLPDSALHYYKTERTASVLSSRDSLESSTQQIWKTTVYGNNISYYDHSGNLINSHSLDLDTLETDLSTLPFESYSDTIVH